MMGLMWFCLGVLLTLSIFALRELHKRGMLDWKGWSGMVLGIFLVLFCIAWSVSSVAEGEPRAASMGLIFFGMSGVIVLILTWRFLLAKSPSANG